MRIHFLTIVQILLLLIVCSSNLAQKGNLIEELMNKRF